MAFGILVRPHSFGAIDGVNRFTCISKQRGLFAVQFQMISMAAGKFRCGFSARIIALYVMAQKPLQLRACARDDAALLPCCFETKLVFILRSRKHQPSGSTRKKVLGVACRRKPFHLAQSARITEGCPTTFISSAGAALKYGNATAASFGLPAPAYSTCACLLAFQVCRRAHYRRNQRTLVVEEGCWQHKRRAGLFARR